MFIVPEQVQKICFQNLPLSLTKISNQISVIKFLKLRRTKEFYNANKGGLTGFRGIQLDRVVVRMGAVGAFAPTVLRDLIIMHRICTYRSTCK